MPVIIRDDHVDVEQIQAAIRARVAARERTFRRASDEELAAIDRMRLAGLADWNFPRAVWAAMWPPNGAPWNLDEDYPLRSHRRGIGVVLVAAKRLARALGGLLARPLLTQQAEINRALALMTRTLANELAAARMQQLTLERRLLHVTAALRDGRGEGEPLVAFADEADVAPDEAPGAD